MKPTLYCLLLTTGLALGCREDEGEVTPPSPEASVTFTTVDANVTDFPPDYSINADRAEGELLIEEETDTAFWNVASVRKIIKEIDGTRFELTYQVNNLTPVRVEFE